MNTLKTNTTSIGTLAKHIFAITLFMSISAFTIAQTHSIQGRVLAQKTNEVCLFANCAIYNLKDTTRIVGGVQTNDKGEFVISGLKKTSYILRISYVGFEKKTITIQASQLNNLVLDLGDIILSESKNSLSDVVITAQKDKIKMDADKLSVTIDDNTASAANNVFDLLKKTPGISIDNNDNLTLSGKSGVLIQFSGKDMKLPWKQLSQLLKGMPATSVEKVEIITNPSAKYDAEGVGGILNIVFKQNKTKGFNASLGTDANITSKQGFYNEDLNLSYVDDKWTTFLSFSAGQFLNSSNTTTNMKNWVLGDTVLGRSVQENKMHYYSYNLNTGVDYRINKTSTVGLNLTYSRSYIAPILIPTTTLITTYPYSFSAPDSSNIMQNSIKQPNNNWLININYQKTFDTLGRKLELNLDFGLNSFDNIEKNITRYYHGTQEEGTLTSQQNIENSTYNSHNSYALRADYLLPFSKTFSMESGAKVALTNVDNDFSSLYNGVNLSGLTNNFLYRENINALYSSINKHFNDKTSLRLGLRIENTNIRGEQKMGKDTTFTQSYVSFFPNITLSHSFSPMYTANFSYNLRISRPTYDNLNPFLSKVNDYTYSTGDPHLKPQYTHTFSLQGTLFYVLFPAISYSYTKNMISQVPIASQTSIMAIMIPSNISSSQNLNISVSAGAPLSKWLTVMGHFGYNYSYNKMTYNNTTSTTKVNSFNSYLSTNFTLPYNIKFSAFGWYTSGGSFGLYEFTKLYGVGLDLNRTFFKELLTFSVGVNNLFTKKNMDVNYNYGPMSINVENEHPINMFHIGLKLNLGSSNTAVESSHKKDTFDQRASGERNTGQGIGK